MRGLATSAVLPLLLGACAFSTGIVPIGPDTYSLSEMRAPVRGGGPEARRAVLADGAGFCARQGRVFFPLEMRPDGDPFTPYYPTAYDATFRCLDKSDPAVSTQAGVVSPAP